MAKTRRILTHWKVVSVFYWVYFGVVAVLYLATMSYLSGEYTAWIKEGRMKRLVVVFLVAVGFLATGLEFRAFADSKDPIIIGAAVDQSGLFKPWDVPAMRALEYALEQKNKQGGINGRKLKFIKGDTKSDITLAPRVAMDLIDQGAKMLLVT